MKWFFKVFTSFLVTLIFLFLFDYLFYNYFSYKEYGTCDFFSKSTRNNDIPPYSIKLDKFKKLYPVISKYNFRPIMNQNNKREPIVIFGCSYAYGYIFPNEETISYVMSKYTDRPIYNRSYCGWGVQHMLFQLKSDKEIYKKIKKPKYVFYVLMNDSSHFERLYYTNFTDILDKSYYFTYKLKNGSFTENKPFLNLYYSFSIFRHIYNKIINKRVCYAFENKDKKLFDFFIAHFKKVNLLIKQNWGNDTKFIILAFENVKKDVWASALEEDGIDIIDISNTIGIRNLDDSKLGFFEPENSPHPNRKIWELLVPKLKEIYTDF